MKRRRTLILGLGNPLRSDDGVGVRIVERLREEGLPDGCAAEIAGTAGLAVLDILQGFERLVVVDAIEAGRPAGEILMLRPCDLAALPPLHVASSHETDLPTALALGVVLDLPMPAETRIVAVQIGDTNAFSEECTPAVAAAVERACRTIRALL